MQIEITSIADALTPDVMETSMPRVYLDPRQEKIVILTDENAIVLKLPPWN